MPAHPLSQEIERISLQCPDVFRDHMIAMEETYHENTLESSLTSCYADAGSARLKAELALFFYRNLGQERTIHERNAIVDHFLEDGAKRAFAKLAGLDDENASDVFSCAIYRLYHLSSGTEANDVLSALFEPLLPYSKTIGV